MMGAFDGLDRINCRESGTTARLIYVKSGIETVRCAVEAGAAGQGLTDVVVVVVERVGAARLLIAAAVDVVEVVVMRIVVLVVVQ